MNDKVIYLDNSATTKPCKECVNAVIESLEKEFYNPSALYKPAMYVQNKIDECRENIANILATESKNVYFVSGGTEANNIAILSQGYKLASNDVVLFSQVEHPSVKNTCKHLQQRGIIVEEIPVDEFACIDLDKLKLQLSKSVKLICVMHVNNEVGAVNNIDKLVKLRDELAPNAAIHVDGVQSFLKIPLSFNLTNIQSYSLSAHKINATKGIGALVLQNGFKLQAINFGGGQENDLRSGTENTSGIYGLNAAINKHFALQNPNANMRKLKLYLYEGLKSKIHQIKYIGPDPYDEELSAPHIINISLYPVRSDIMINALSAQNIYCSSGAACSSKKQKINSALLSIGTKRELAESAIRFSFSPYNSFEEVDIVIDSIVEIYNKFHKYTRR